MTIRKKILHCKLEINGRMVEQVMEFNYLGVKITSSGSLIKEIKIQAQKCSKSGWLFEWSCLEKQIHEERNKIENIQGNRMPDYDICTRNKGKNIKNQTNLEANEIESTKENSWKNKNR